LWDGQDSRLPGGTADTVLRYLDASAAIPAHIGFVDDAGDTTTGHQFVYWVPAARKSSDVDLQSTSPCYLSTIGESLLRRHSDMPAELGHQLAELDDYNREFNSLLSNGRIQGTDSLLRTLPAGMTVPDSSLLREIDAEYGKADALAVFYQRYSDRLFKWFSLMASAMGLLFLVYAKLVDSKLFLLGYLGVLILGLGVFYSVRGRHWFSKHLVYRVLAETMRTKFYLRLASADRHLKAEDLISLTGIDQFEGFSWITNILKSVEPFVERDAPDQAEARKKIDSVHRAWIEGQQKYFKSKVKRLEKNHHRLERMKGILFMALVIITLVILMFGGGLRATELGGEVSLKDVLMFLMGLLPVWLGIWEIYQNKMATRELLWQYRNQLSHFSRAQLQLARASGWARHAAILAELGRESLMESYLWTIHRYHREHEPPASG
jgi:cadmium resistance protein CadD (predicted permease)